MYRQRLNLDREPLYIGTKKPETSSAPELTQQSENRTNLANQRTVLAYDRTSLSVLGMAIAIAKLFDSHDELVIASAIIWIIISFLFAVTAVLVASDRVKESQYTYWLAQALFFLGLVVTSLVILQVSNGGNIL